MPNIDSTIFPSQRQIQAHAPTHLIYCHTYDLMKYYLMIPTEQF